MRTRLSVSPAGARRPTLKKTYRQLVKRWHPDRYAADPAGQSEAQSRMRDINGAFRLVAEDVAGPRRASSPAHWRATAIGPRRPRRVPRHATRVGPTHDGRSTRS